MGLLVWAKYICNVVRDCKAFFSSVVLWPEERGFFHIIAESLFQGYTHRRIWGVLTKAIKRGMQDINAPEEAAALPHLQPSGSAPSHCGRVHPLRQQACSCPHQDQEEHQDPEMLCHYSSIGTRSLSSPAHSLLLFGLLSALHFDPCSCPTKMHAVSKVRGHAWGLCTTSMISSTIWQGMSFFSN